MVTMIRKPVKSWPYCLNITGHPDADLDTKKDIGYFNCVSNIIFFKLVEIKRQR